MKKNTVIISLFFLVFIPAGYVDSFAETGITDSEIILGQSCALTGPAKALGLGMRAGLKAYFEKINQSGGIHGRSIRLISLDDGYEPVTAIKNTRRLINKENIFSAIGYVGTPTSKAVFPIFKQSGIPFFSPFTGAEFLRTPLKRNVISIRASYYQEMEKIADYLVSRLGKTRIACFFQNDDYGQAGLKGITDALKKRSLNLVATGRYERNSIAVKSGFLKIRRADPEAVVMVGAYQPCAEFIRVAKKYGLENAVFCNISFVGTRALINELGPLADGIIISQVFQLPDKTDIPLINEFRDDMKQFCPEQTIGLVSLEGYVAAKFFCQAASKAGRTLTRENLIDSIEATGTFDLGGLRLNFGKQDHQGSDEIFITIVKNGKIQPI